MKIKTSIEYVNNYKDTVDNDINEQIIDYTIKEIKIKQKWVEIKEKWKESVEAFVDDLILTNKGKNQDELNTSSVYNLVNKLREKIASTKNEITKELEIAIEIAIEIDDQNDILIKCKNKLQINEEKEKKGPGRPKKVLINSNIQKKMTDYL